jgi:DNA (cytosine-5)-methyltransferase 3A
MEQINVLSLFDGMSCGQQALERSGIKIDNYYASEIDKFAIKVTMSNYPKTIQLGNVLNVNGDNLPPIYLLIGGSPCQSFSFAGKRKGMATKCEIEILTLEYYLELKSEGYQFEGQSYLFWEFMRLLKECKPKYFLLENVEMGDRWERILSKAIGVNGIHINSALVSAQNRKRIYWTNIGMQPSGLFGDLESIIRQPKDKKIFLRDILETEVDKKYFLSDKMINLLTSRIKNSHSFNSNFIKIDKKGNLKKDQKKAGCFSAGAHSGGNHSDMDLIVHNTMPRSGDPKKGGTGHLSRNDGKTYCLDAANSLAVEVTSNIRRLSPIEAERLQTVADDYTNHVSDSQRYKMLGNGWTVDVIAHIFSYL